MSVTVKGVPQLRSRLEALTPDPLMMRDLALHAIRYQKELVPRKTGNLGRSIGIGRVTATTAETIATAEYAIYVHEGTGLYGPKGQKYDIVPRYKKVLRWPAAGSATLSGRVKSGGSAIFAKHVKHPGIKPQPFMVDGAKKAVDELGVDAIVKRWNDAA